MADSKTPKKIPVDLRSYYKMPHPQLKSYLDRQVTGNNTLITTPLWGSDQNFWSAVEHWRSHLRNTLGKSFDGLLAFELEMAEKIGPMSIQKPLVERFPSINSYYTGVGSGDPFSDSVVQSVKSYVYGDQAIHLQSYAQTDMLMKHSTNSGSPLFTKRSRVQEETAAYKIVGPSQGSIMIEDEALHRYTLCATLGWRGQEGGPSLNDTKQRDLWMFPYFINVHELRAVQPAVKRAQRRLTIPGWCGNDVVDRHITALFDSRKSNDIVMVTDFTKFDQHMGGNMQEIALKIADAIFVRDDDYEWWREVIFPIAYNIPLCIGRRTMLLGSHSMGSGSGRTSFDETNGHKALQYDAAERDGQQLNPYSTALGDDGIITYPSLRPERVLDAYRAHNQEMNESKQSVSRNECIYLRRWHSTDYRKDNIMVGVYPTLRALGKLRYMERWHDDWDEKQIIMRSLSIIENCCHHPERDAFLRLCLEGDKYALGLKIPGFFDSLEKEYDRALSAGNLGYQYTDDLAPKPLRDWWVVRALAKM